MQNKPLLFIIPLIMSAFFHADAQFKLSTQVPFVSYLQFEPVVVETKITSEMGQPTVFNMDEDDPKFYYLVRDENGYILPARDGVEHPHPAMLPPRSAETITNNILEIYALRTPGYYSIQPCIDWRGKSYLGEKRHIEVESGREMTRSVGIVPADGSARLYRLLHINRKLQDHLLLRIDDEDGHLCYGVFLLGRTVTLEKPKLAIDSQAQAHVVFRNSPRSHIYTSYSPMGYMLSYEVYGQQYAEVNLTSRPDGTIDADAEIDTRRGTDVPNVESIIEKNKMRRE